jgi:hypothetical protein
MSTVPSVNCHRLPLVHLNGRVFFYLSYFSHETESPTLEVLTVRHSEMLVNFYHMEKRHIPEDITKLIFFFPFPNQIT